MAKYLAIVVFNALMQVVIFTVVNVIESIGTLRLEFPFAHHSRERVIANAELLMHHLDQIIALLHDNQIKFNIHESNIVLCSTFIRPIVTMENIVNYNPERPIFAICRGLHSGEYIRLSFNDLIAALPQFIERHKSFSVYAISPKNEIILDMCGFPALAHSEMIDPICTQLLALSNDYFGVTISFEALDVDILERLQVLASHLNKLYQCGWYPRFDIQMNLIFNEQYSAAATVTVLLNNVHSPVTYRIVDNKTEEIVYAYDVDALTGTLNEMLVNTNF